MLHPFRLAEKLRIVEESSLPRVSVSYVARKQGISPNQLFRWRKHMIDDGKVATQADDQVVSASETRTLKKRARVTCLAHFGPAET